MARRTWVALLALSIAAIVPAAAQSPGRSATTQAALRASPVFFHGRQIAVLGSVVEARGLYQLTPQEPNGAAAVPASPGQGIYIYWRDRPSRASGEIRGEFWDLGRLTEGDPRFPNYDFRTLVENVAEGRWPGRDQLFVLIGATMVEPVLPETPSLRAIALAPEKYENRSVKVSGRFRGRNLHADIASPLPTPGKYDFIVQSADASVWISGLRPKGQGFELDPGARVDTGRWLQISGTVRRDGSRVWIEGREIELSAPPAPTDDGPVEVPATAPEPPPTVVFSAPVADDIEVDPAAVLRIQFSRDMDVRTFKDRIRVAYAPRIGAGTAPPPPVFTFVYNVGSRGLEVKFTKPLERLQTVKVDLLEGITAIGGDPLRPWSLSFMTGG